MAVDDEVTVRRLLVLADASLDQRDVFQGREAEGDVFANVFQRFLADGALTGVGSKAGPRVSSAILKPRRASPNRAPGIP